jgi:alkylation response protein AidB-like acyl-CoA dehydrogenase
MDPKEIISTQDVQLIRERAASSEDAGCLSEEVLALIYKRKWFRVMMPKSLGGGEWPLPETVRLFEALACADANVGWCVNLGAGANMFSGYLAPEAAKAIFRDEKVCCAGSGALSGSAHKVKGGFCISGKWKYASGAAHASHFTANCLLFDEAGLPVMENGQQAFRSFIFPAERVILGNTWKVIGLKATSSDDFEVRDLFVPEANTFSLLRASDFEKGPLYQFPFDLLAVVNMACMPTGIAFHFIEQFEALASKKKPLHSNSLLKDNEQVKIIFENSTKTFYAARNEMYSSLQQVWSVYEKGSLPSAALEHAVTSAARNAAGKARALVQELFPLCGMDILYTDAPLNKIWRDMATAGQHYLLSPLCP